MFDIGVNLTSSQFAKDRDDIVARAFDAGVNGLLITGTNLRESQQAQKLARQYSSCWSTAGVHPHDSKDGDDRVPVLVPAFHGIRVLF